MTIRGPLQVARVAQALGVTPRRVKGWAEQGLLKPVRQGRGPGRRRAFDLEGLATGAILLELQGVLGQKSPFWGPLVRKVARLVAAHIRNPGASPLTRVPSGVILLVALRRGRPSHVRTVHLGTLAERIVDDLDAGRAVTVIDLGHIVERIQRRLSKWGAR